MKNPVKFEPVLSFNQLYDDEPSPIASYLEGIERKFILKILIHLKEWTRENPENSEAKHFIKTIFSKSNGEYAYGLVKRVEDLEKSYKMSFVISTNEWVTNTIIQEVLKLSDDYIKIQGNEVERQIFKALMATNSLFLNKERIAHSTIAQHPFPDNLFFRNLATTFSYWEFSEFNIYHSIIAQTVKGFYVFKFLEMDEKASPLLKHFLNEFELNSWHDFIWRGLGFVNLLQQKEVNNKTYNVFSIPDDDDGSFKTYLNNFVLQNARSFQEDFVILRKNPIIEISDNQYLILSEKFLIESFYESIYFRLAKINNKINIVPSLKSYLSFEFGEKFLFYEIMNEIHKGKERKYFINTGNDFELRGISGGPDYYVRKGEKIFLFEFKNPLIKKEVKQSFDFCLISKELEEKLYQNKIGKPKGVKQLINQIGLIEQKGLIDEGFKPKRVKVYPIIVTDLRILNAPGVEYLLNQWFDKELSDLSINERLKKRVWPLTIIDIDSLIIFSESFKEKGNYFDDLVTKYHKKKKNALSKLIKNQVKTGGWSMKFFQKSLLNFKHFIGIEFEKKMKTPKILESFVQQEKKWLKEYNKTLSK